jgi:hypothetical protein
MCLLQIKIYDIFISGKYFRCLLKTLPKVTLFDTFNVPLFYIELAFLKLLRLL